MADLNHLHLHVRDTAVAKRFYAKWFGFREHVRHGEILFLRDAADFDLALAPDRKAGSLPRWFHFGFRLRSAAAVRALHRRMRAARLRDLKPLHDDPEFVTFRVRDPDDYGIEVYWE